MLKVLLQISQGLRMADIHIKSYFYEYDDPSILHIIKYIWFEMVKLFTAERQNLRFNRSIILLEVSVVSIYFQWNVNDKDLTLHLVVFGG